MNAKRRVAVFRSELLHPSETFIRDQVSALTAWEPVLVGRKEVEGGLPTPNIPREIVPESGNRLSRTFRFWLSKPDPMLVAKLQQLQVDLVHVHFGTDAADIWPSVMATGLPMVVTLHGYDINTNRKWFEAGHAGPRRRVYPRRLLKMSHDPTVRFIAASIAIKRRAVEYGIPEEKISVAYIGIDTDVFTPGGLPIHQRARQVLFIGRMVENKCPLALIRAFSIAKKQIIDATLVMIGDGPQLDAAKALSENLGLPIIFLGTCDSKTVLSQIHLSRVLCLPSITIKNGASEGLGQVLLEAQAVGLPVIGSETGGIPEAVNQTGSGFIVPPGDDEALARCISICLSDEFARKIDPHSTRNFVIRTFDLKNQTKKLQSIYEGLAQE